MKCPVCKDKKMQLNKWKTFWVHAEEKDKNCPITNIPHRENDDCLEDIPNQDNNPAK